MESFKKQIEIFKKEFNEVELSDREQYLGIYIGHEYEKKINKIIGVSENIQLKSFFTISSYKTDFQKDPNKIQLYLSFSFAYYHPVEKSYPLMLPKETKLTYCPKNYDIKDKMYFNSTNCKFYNKNKIVDIVRYIKKIMRRNNRVLNRFIGLPIRVTRLLLWNIINPICNILTKILMYSFYLFTGDRLKIDKEEFIFHYFIKEIKVELKILSEEESKTVDFFGMKVKLPPLVFYSTIHILFFTIFYLIGFKPNIIKTVFILNKHEFVTPKA